MFLETRGEFKNPPPTPDVDTFSGAVEPNFSIPPWKLLERPPRVVILLEFWFAVNDLI